MDHPETRFVSPLKVIMAASRFYFSWRFLIIAVGLSLLFAAMMLGPWVMFPYGVPVALAVNSLFFVLMIKYYTNMLRGGRRPLFSDFSIGTVLLQTAFVAIYVFGGSILAVFSGYVLMIVFGLGTGGLFGLLDYGGMWGFFALCILFSGGCLSPGGWLIVEHNMDQIQALVRTLRILRKNIPTLLVFFFWTLLFVGGTMIGMDRLASRFGEETLVHRLADYQVVWFFVAPFLMLHYPIFCMLATGEKIGFVHEKCEKHEEISQHDSVTDAGSVLRLARAS